MSDTLTFNDALLWKWAREIAAIAQRYPSYPPERIADDVMAEVVTARIECEGGAS